MQPLDCKGEFNKCKIDIVDNRKSEMLKELLKQISGMGKRRKKGGGRV